MTKAALCVLLVTVASAQKRPITLDALDEPEAPRAERSVVWAPDGGHFAFREEGKLMVYDVTARKSKPIATIRDLASAASRAPFGDGPFDWTNRRERVGGLEWSPDGKALLLSAGGDIFLVRADNGKWEQLTNTPELELDAKLSPAFIGID